LKTKAVNIRKERVEWKNLESEFNAASHAQAYSVQCLNFQTKQVCIFALTIT